MPMPFCLESPWFARCMPESAGRAAVKIDDALDPDDDEASDELVDAAHAVRSVPTPTKRDLSSTISNSAEHLDVVKSTHCAQPMHQGSTVDAANAVRSVPTPIKRDLPSTISSLAETVNLDRTHDAKERPETDDVESLYRMMSTRSTFCKSQSTMPDDVQRRISSRSLGPDQIEVVLGKWDRSKSLGMALHVSEDGFLIIRSVTNGLMQTYNASADEDLQVMPNDAIVAVDGRGGEAAELLAYFKARDAETAAAEGNLKLFIRRPRMYSIEIQRAHAPLGLSVDHEPTALRVFSVKSGMFSNWNVSLGGAQLKRNDRIVRVNGSQGQSQEMLNEMKLAAVQHRPLSLSFLRY
eukprot:TRINITY_DN73485_c0_g1_i1.p1 TRINITY_DN73485_c0_g1~~TRINITY_DN73485_c0_g1_i1.p1  ORF type:complete len:367 (+),score=69.14 TRINITY_DN73485_c0_g1_i1:48-1103(+)